LSAGKSADGTTPCDIRDGKEARSSDPNNWRPTRGSTQTVKCGENRSAAGPSLEAVISLLKTEERLIDVPSIIVALSGGVTTAQLTQPGRLALAVPVLSIATLAPVE